MSLTLKTICAVLVKRNFCTAVAGTHQRRKNVEEVGVEVPVVVRFEGNNSDLGRQKLAESGLNIIPGESLVDAAEKAVAAAGGQA